VPKGAELIEALPVSIGITLAQSGVRDLGFEGRPVGASFLKVLTLPRLPPSQRPWRQLALSLQTVDVHAGPSRDVAKADAKSPIYGRLSRPTTAALALPAQRRPLVPSVARKPECPRATVACVLNFAI